MNGDAGSGRDDTLLTLLDTRTSRFLRRLDESIVMGVTLGVMRSGNLCLMINRPWRNAQHKKMKIGRRPSRCPRTWGIDASNVDVFFSLPCSLSPASSNFTAPIYQTWGIRASTLTCSSSLLTESSRIVRSLYTGQVYKWN